MFFRRAPRQKLTFEDHLKAARAAGFRTEPAGAGKTRVERNGIACMVEPGNEDVPRVVARAGIVMGQEIGTLTDGGFQKFFLTPQGKRQPALAEQLKAIQDFQEDLREAWHLTSLYNESLGTVSNLYLYDRVEGRDFGQNNKPWQVQVGSATPQK